MSAAPGSGVASVVPPVVDASVALSAEVSALCTSSIFGNICVRECLVVSQIYSNAQLLLEAGTSTFSVSDSPWVEYTMMES